MNAMQIVYSCTRTIIVLSIAGAGAIEECNRESAVGESVPAPQLNEQISLAGTARYAPDLHN